MPTRRAVLRRGGAVGLGLLALPILNACGHGQLDVSPTPDAKRVPSGGGAAEQVLLASYAAALDAHPYLAPFLVVPMSHHRTHAVTLGSQALPAGSVPVASQDPVVTVQGLITLERNAAADRVTQAVAGSADGDVLAAIAASESVHALLLTAELPAIRTAAATQPPSSPGSSGGSTQADGQSTGQVDGQTTAADPGQITLTTADGDPTQGSAPTGGSTSSTPAHNAPTSASSQPSTPSSSQSSSAPTSPPPTPTPTPTTPTPTPTPTPTTPTPTPTPTDSDTPTPTDSDTSDPIPSISLSLPPLPSISVTVPGLGLS